MRGKHLLLLLVLFLIGSACSGEDQQDTTTVAYTDTTVARQYSTDTTAGTGVTTTSPPETTAAPAEPDGGEFPVTVDGVVIPERPVAIISLSPTATEILFALGAGSKVIAVDAMSNYPADAPITDMSGFQPNVEAIAAFGPDLVVISWDTGDVATGLEALGIPVIVHSAAANLDDAYQQMRALGQATGNPDAAESLVTSIEDELAELVEQYGAVGQGLTYYHEVDDNLYSATSATFIGNVYGLFGLENIADAADIEGFGYPQLSSEYIIETDPDLIFYGCAVWCGTTAEVLAERPGGWNGLQAVETGTLIEVDDDLSSRWGPRIIEFARLIGDVLSNLS